MQVRIFRVLVVVLFVLLFIVSRQVVDVKNTVVELQEEQIEIKTRLRELALEVAECRTLAEYTYARVPHPTKSPTRKRLTTMG